MNARECRLSKPMIDILVNQINNEMQNYGLYRSIQNLFALEGIADLEEYYRKRAMEEFNHQQWIIDYLNYQDAEYTMPAIDHHKDKVESMLQAFEVTVDAEIRTTAQIQAIYKLANEEGDTFTRLWLDDKLGLEQLEEESVSRTALDIFRLEDTNILTRAKMILALLDEDKNPAD